MWYYLTPEKVKIIIEIHIFNFLVFYSLQFVITWLSYTQYCQVPLLRTFHFLKEKRWEFKNGKSEANRQLSNCNQ